ncbi:hypothetical protein DYB28_014069, partial [Aphanomyces astaci]
IGTSSNPMGGEVKDFKAFFDKFLYFPYPDYPSRVLLWRATIQSTIQHHSSSGLVMYTVLLKGVHAAWSNRSPPRIPDELDTSTLAHISEGFSSGSIRRAVENTLSARRVERMEKRPLKEDEFIGALARQTATFADDHEKFKNFTAQVTGLKETRDAIRKALAGDAEGADEKGKDKKGGKKGGKKGKK